MPVTYVSGDPLLSRAQVIAFGQNAKGRTESGALELALMQAYPAAFAAYRKRCRHGRIQTGGIWLWRESKPMLAFLTVRESSVGATRLRFVQTALMTLARDYPLESIRTLALAPLGTPDEWITLQQVVNYWMGNSALPVAAYTEYVPGVAAEEGLVQP